MNPLESVFISGAIAATFMAIFLLTCFHRRWISQNMIWSLGMLVTKRVRNAEIVGLSIHVMAGICFAFLYVMLWSTFNFSALSTFVAVGFVTGLLHGIGVVVSQIIILTNRNQGFNVAAAHVAAHAIYGTVLGSLLGLFEQEHAVMSHIALMIRAAYAG